MLKRSEIIDSLVHVGTLLNESNEALKSVILKTYVKNNWLTESNYWKSIGYWKEALTKESLSAFVKPYQYSINPRKVGIIMAGNIPLVGFHDLICVLLSGNKAIIKPSSEDEHVIKEIVNILIDHHKEFDTLITVVDKLTNIEAAIATGSNNSFKYFEYYFKDIPNLLRKNRKSLAILSGNETDEELELLSNDVFEYFGLGCRNVSLILLPQDMDITRVIDNFEKHNNLKNHNKFANNYTYHRAILLMNNEQHLDNGFALYKHRKDLNAPLACINYAHYNSLEEIEQFLDQNNQEIQCIVGNSSTYSKVNLGNAQTPNLQDFADDINTLEFLENLNS